MPKVALYDISGAQLGEVELSEAVFAAPVNTAVMHEVVKAYLANQRQGTQSTLTRAEVRGGISRNMKSRSPQITSFDTCLITFPRSGPRQSTGASGDSSSKLVDIS